MKYIQHQPIQLKGHAEYDERWVQARIAENPSLLGLGDDLEVRDTERRQPRGRRLDILLEDAETERRYEVELQLGATDETHILRTIEYWDVERKRFPRYDHCAVIIAEDITSRFLNVVSLFNGAIPLVAIQIKAVAIGDQVTLVFTKVIDEMLPELEEETTQSAAKKDRAYWEERSSPAVLKDVDLIMAAIQKFRPDHQLNYNIHHIGLMNHGVAENVAIFNPRRNHTLFNLRMDQLPECDEILNEAGLEWRYKPKWRLYQIHLGVGEAAKALEKIGEACKLAAENWKR